MVTRREALRAGTGFLKASRLADNPRLDAEVLLRYLLGISRTELYRDLDEDLPALVLSRYRELLARRAAGEPLQYLTGEREFMGLDFRVTPAVLIPRPETEIVVETALELARQELSPAKDKPLTLVDLGTGSGAIAVSLARFLPGARVYGVDISGAALAVAWENARRHGVADRITLCCGDFLTPLAAVGLFSRVDLLVSNPPYIPRGDLDNLPREVRVFEPRRALDGGEDGLEFYRRLAAGAPAFLRPGGWLVLEVGQGQAAAVRGLLE
ncbi:MAG TPA: peptide chain release factor N(5)-glutamine methyltransferase, partial [Firmicutes bacterium]|nr:peptide chain release factor N(5)-glutamine methyltransferase [Bacillota bacterium]